MFWHILKKDLKRKKTMNTIVFLFVTLAALFMSSALNNIITVVNGLDTFMDISRVGDYVLFVTGKGEIAEVEDILRETDKIDNWRVENGIVIEDEDVFVNDTALENNMSYMIMKVYDSGYVLFDEQNRPVTEVPRGCIRLSSNDATANHLKTGDKITLHIGNKEKTFLYIGAIKDALLGSPMNGIKRVVINEEEYSEIKEYANDTDNFEQSCIYVDTDDTQGLLNDLSRANIDYVGYDRNTLKFTYLMDVVLAATLMLFSVCLIAVSFWVLKFTIRFTITEEFREIGIMKAIGMHNIMIRSLYIIKYLGLAVSGTVLGFIGSIPFAERLLLVASKNIVLTNANGIWLNIVGSVVVVVMIVGYAFICTDIIRKSSPIDAIRQGQTGERYSKKRGVRISNYKFGLRSYLAVNDIFSSPKRYYTILLVYVLAGLLVFSLANMDKSIGDKAIEKYMTGVTSDTYIVYSDNEFTYKRDVQDKMDELKRKFEEIGLDVRLTTHNAYSVAYRNGGVSQKIMMSQIDGTDEDIEYSSGRRPMTIDEIGVSNALAKAEGIYVGDTIEVEYPDGPHKCLVTGLFDSLMMLGKTMRIPSSAPVERISSCMGIQVKYLDNPSESVIEERKKLIESLTNDKVTIFTTTEFVKFNIGVGDAILGLELFLAAMMVIIMGLVTVLMEKSFISDEKGQIAMLKAVGIKNGLIQGWHILRFAFVTLVSLALSIPLSLPVAKLGMTVVFNAMGTTPIPCSIDVNKVCVIYPIILFTVAIIVVSITSFRVNKIKANDTANIE